MLTALPLRDDPNATRNGRVENLALSTRGGGEQYVKRHLARGRLLPRERIEMLLDEGSYFLEIAPLAGIRMENEFVGAQVGIITPAKIGVLPSIEMVVWVAAGGRGTLYGAIVGAFGVNWIQSWLTTSYPDLWLLFLGGLFMGAVLFFPDGIVGALGRLAARARRLVGQPTAEPKQGTAIDHCAPMNSK